MISNSKKGMALKTVDLLDEAYGALDALGEEFEGSRLEAYRATLYLRSCHAFSRVRRHWRSRPATPRSNRTRVSKPTRLERLLSSGTTPTTTLLETGAPPSTRPAARERMPSDCSGPTTREIRLICEGG